MHNLVAFLVLSVRMFTMSCFMEHSCWSPSLGGWGWEKGAHCWSLQLLELDPVLQLQLLLLEGYAHLDRFLWTWQEVVFCKHILKHKLRNYCNAIANINSPIHGAMKIKKGHFPMVVESEIHLRSSDHGDLSGQNSLTVGNCPRSIYFINRTNPHGHWIWISLSTTMGKCPDFSKYKSMTAPWIHG